MLVLALIAVLLAAINISGGFVVTDRMLRMFVRRRPELPGPGQETGTATGTATGTTPGSPTGRDPR